MSYNTLLGIQRCMILLEGQRHVSVVWPIQYRTFDSMTEGMPDLFFIFIHAVQLLCEQEDALEGMHP